MYLEPVRKQKQPDDDPSMGVRIGMLAVLVVVLFSLLGFRLWFLQILSGDRYVSLANTNRVREVAMEAPRGVIYDHKGKVLVVNKPGLSVGILPMDLQAADEVIPRLARVLGMPEADIRARLEKAAVDPYLVTTIKEDVPEATTVAYLKEHSLEFPGVRIEKAYLRDYPRHEFATHVLGYVGEISAADLDKEKYREVKPGARIGKDGVEATYDSFLRGTDGKRTVEVDAAGRPKRVLEEINPLPGNNLWLTIDYKLQVAAEKALTEGIARAHAGGFTAAAAGAVVAIDPRTGEILAMASWPDYDLSLWVGGMKQTDYSALTGKDAHNPLFNRAISGLYPAASTFKPFVASTALSNDLITRDTPFFDPGNFKYKQQVWKCWKPEGHGEVNLVEAIMESCDVYFYNLGRKLYDQTSAVLQAGVKQFGFGRVTGVDLPGEVAGRVPDKDWKKATGATKEDRIWKPGDDINLAIGQGDLLITPLQLAVASAAIANGGDVFVPRLALKVTDASGNTLKEFETETRGHVQMSAENLDTVRRGMRYVVSEPDGTAHGAFSGFPVSVAGKTGTAEKKPEDDYAWFMGYAPADAPEILVVALIEQGGHGSSVAAPMVRRVMEAYFGVKAPPPGSDQAPVTE
jgi:penicillin-binding protein 2